MKTPSVNYVSLFYLYYTFKSLKFKRLLKAAQQARRENTQTTLLIKGIFNTNTLAVQNMVYYYHRKLCLAAVSARVSRKSKPRKSANAQVK
jgi:hypothetical protein